MPLQQSPAAGPAELRPCVPTHDASGETGRPWHPVNYAKWHIQAEMSSWQNCRMPHDQDITLGQMRQFGPGLLHVFCGDDKCAYSVAIDPECWPASLWLSDLESLFVCTVCGHRGAKVRMEFGKMQRLFCEQQG